MRKEGQGLDSGLKEERMEGRDDIEVRALALKTLWSIVGALSMAQYRKRCHTTTVEA